jgi:hypothetical protein
LAWKLQFIVFYTNWIILMLIDFIYLFKFRCSAIRNSFTAAMHAGCLKVDAKAPGGG